MSILRLDLKYTLRNKNGKIVKEIDWKPANSFVIQFLEILWVYFPSAQQNITDITGAEDMWTASNIMTADTLGSNEGIILGTDNTAPTNTDHALGTRIVHGNGAGELAYGAMTYNQPVDGGGNVDFVMQRTFTNNSGGAIGVEEAGFYVDEAVTAKYRCLIHDLLSVSIPDTNAITVEYRLRTTV